MDTLPLEARTQQAGIMDTLEIVVDTNNPYLLAIS